MLDVILARAGNLPEVQETVTVINYLTSEE